MSRASGCYTLRNDHCFLLVRQPTQVSDSRATGIIESSKIEDRTTALHDKHGIPFPYAHNGHGIGLFVHDQPIIGPHDDTDYEHGITTTVETRVRWVNKVGYYMEDLLELTEGAPIVHSD